jgi:hypothetical protein
MQFNAVQSQFYHFRRNIMAVGQTGFQNTAAPQIPSIPSIPSIQSLPSFQQPGVTGAVGNNNAARETMQQMMGQAATPAAPGAPAGGVTGAVGNNNAAKATMEQMMAEGTELSMMSMKMNNQQTLNSMLMTANSHENNARITAVDTIGKLMNKGFNKANAAVQSQ